MYLHKLKWILPLLDIQNAYFFETAVCKEEPKTLKLAAWTMFKDY